MARPGITCEQVAAVADALVGDGQQPTIRAVRERLGTGSPNTIHRCLTNWRAERPAPTPPPAPRLPDELQRALAEALERAAARAKADVEARLVETQAELADLAAGGEALEAERDALEEDVVRLTRERDELAGTVKQQNEELAERAREIERERLAAETARVEQAKGELRIEALGERLAEQLQALERLRAELEAEREARRQAEQKAAVLEARLGDCHERIRLAEQRSAQADERARTVEREQQRLTMQIQAQQAALDQTVREVEAAKKAVSEQQERARRAIEEAAELRGQLKSSMEIQTRGTTSKNSK